MARILKTNVKSHEQETSGDYHPGFRPPRCFAVCVCLWPAGVDLSGGRGTRMPSSMPLMTASTFPAWSKSIEAVEQFHGVDRQAGLTTQQVADKRRQYGFNELEKAPGKPMWRLVLEQFDDMMVKVGGSTSPVHTLPDSDCQLRARRESYSMSVACCRVSQGISSAGVTVGSVCVLPAGFL